MLKPFRRLRLSTKLAICFLAFALPLSVLGFFMDLSFVYDINMARMEKAGISCQRDLAVLLRQVPRYQMLQLGLRGGELGATKDLPELKNKIDASLVQVRKSVENLAPKLRFVPQPLASKELMLETLSELESAWRKERQLPRGEPLSPRTLNAAFSLFRQLADASYLRVDPALDSNHLMEVTLWGLPAYLHRQLEITRSLAPLFSRHEPLPATLLPMMLRAQIQEGATLLESVARDHILESSRIAIREDTAFYGATPGLHDVYAQSLERFMQSAQNLQLELTQLGTPGSLVGPKSLERTLAASYEHSCHLYDLAVRELRIMLDSRIASYQSWRLTGSLVSMAALLLTLGLVFLIGRDITRPLIQLMAYTREIREGNYATPLPDVPGKDMQALAGDIQNMVRELKHRLAFSQGILESIVAPFLVVDVNNRITFVNLAMLQLLEVAQEPENCLGRDVIRFFNENKRVAVFLEQCMIQRVCVENQETDILGHNGGSSVISLTVSPLYDLEEELIGACFFVFDLTELKRHEMEILNKNIEIERLAAFPRENPEPVLSADASGTVIYRNPATDAVLRNLNLTINELLPPNHVEVTALCLKTTQKREQIEHAVGERIFEFIYSPLASHNSVQIHAADITERRRMERQLLHDAFHDALTGLPNRALLLDRLSQTLARSKKGSKDYFAVMLVDIDSFKFVNDSLGHSTGDLFLQQIAVSISQTLGKSDTLARLGGDEFIVLLESIATVSDALTTAERIQQALAQPEKIMDYELSATASIGIVVDNGSYDEPENLLRDADAAMFRAKSLGRARSEVFDEAMHLNARNRLSLEIDLKRALERGELEAYYQPLVCLKSGRIGGFEALMRWNHPERGVVSPGEFIPLAEETGLIVPMGLNILEEACAQAQAWRQKFAPYESLMMSVNLSVRQFRSLSLLQDVQEILERTGFPGGQLKLEVTESGIMEDMENSLTQMHGLRELGVRLSIDDFGTGYSSLSYLPRFPFDFIKVDRSFVSGLETESAGANELHTVVATIVALAHDMGKEIIAEGIETDAQLGLLRQLSCEYGQGFLFSRPRPVAEAALLLAENRVW